MPKCFNFRFLNLFSSSHLCNRKFWSRDILSDLGHHQILKGQSFPQNRHSNSDHLSVQWVCNSLWLFANSMKSWLLKCCSDLELSWLMLLLIKRTWTYDYIVGQIHCLWCLGFSEDNETCYSCSSSDTPFLVDKIFE